MRPPARGAAGALTSLGRPRPGSVAGDDLHMDLRGAVLNRGGPEPCSISNARTPSSRVVHGNFTEAHRHADQTDRAGGRGPPRPRRRAPLPLRLPLHRAAGARGMRILIVEDEVLIAWMLADCLECAGHEVIGPAAAMAEALA